MSFEIGNGGRFGLEVQEVSSASVTINYFYWLIRISIDEKFRPFFWGVFQDSSEEDETMFYFVFSNF